jgi:hypothetical protein
MIKSNCEICGNEFMAYPCEIRTRHKVTCSYDCLRIKRSKSPTIFKIGHKKVGGFDKGDKHTIETIERMKTFQKINIKAHWPKGKKHSEASKLKMSEANKGMIAWNKGIFGIFVGEKAMNWQGGKSFEKYGREFDSQLKERIRFRDGYKCRNCGCSQLENGKQLDIHHIDYIKKNFSDNNLIALCVPCHRKTCATKKRQYWIDYYMNLMKDFKCLEK